MSVEVLQEVSTLTTQTIQAALNAPVISTREAATRAIIRNGQTVVIVGIGFLGALQRIRPIREGKMKIAPFPKMPHH